MEHAPTIPAQRLDPRLRGLIAGSLAMLAFLVVMDVFRQATDAPSLIDSLAETFLAQMPMSMFSLSLDLFGAQAKTMLLAGLIVAMLVIGAWIGYRYVRNPISASVSRWSRAATSGIGIFGATALFMLWSIADRPTGGVASRETLTVMVQLGIATIAFVIVLVFASTALVHRVTAPAPADAGRRRLLSTAALGLGGLVGVAVLGRTVARVAGRPTVGTNDPGEISPPITSNDDFYLISKNFSDPSDDPGDDWSITVGGLVESQLTLSRTDLEAMAAPPFVSTLTCISNPVGGPLISTAEWRGVRLADVLKKARVGPGAVDLVITGADDYTDSIPIERALQPEPMLVWEMNGERLPQRHGIPLRLIVPGIYGMKNVKWVTGLEVVNNDYLGFWEKQGWTDDATVKTMSRFDVPSNRDVYSTGRYELGGVAFAGDRGISKVEISLDDGDTWQDASIRDNPSPAGLSWVIWTYEWNAQPGGYDLAVRATDGTGEVQTADHAPELPDGASGYHRITVGVS